MVSFVTIIDSNNRYICKNRMLFPYATRVTDYADTIVTHIDSFMFDVETNNTGGCDCDIPDNGNMIDLDNYNEDTCVQCGRLLTINDQFLCKKCSEQYDVKMITIRKKGE